jgi:uncharacterized protein (TIGR03067 family)
LPVLELRFDDARGEVSYRWKADEKAFAMPIRVGTPDSWQTITPTAHWQTLKSPLAKEEFQVATDWYYVMVSKAADDQGQNKPDPSKTPKAIDRELTQAPKDADKGETAPGIYALDGDTRNAPASFPHARR